VKTTRVVIIGGGPGGTACASTLQRLAGELDHAVHVTLLEGKQFSGEQHYNQCVGVLSPPLPALLEERLCVPFPYHLARNQIKGYVLHTLREEIALETDEGSASLSSRRVHFDAYMLEQVRARGVSVLPPHRLPYRAIRAERLQADFDCRAGIQTQGLDPPPRVVEAGCLQRAWSALAARVKTLKEAFGQLISSTVAEVASLWASLRRSSDSVPKMLCFLSEHHRISLLGNYLCLQAPP